MSGASLRQELTRVVRELRQRYRPEAIILFGSLAQGRGRPTSDIDLVVVKRTTKLFVERLREVALLHHAQVGVDILVYTPDEWQRLQREHRRFVVNEIVRKGRILYRAA